MMRDESEKQMNRKDKLIQRKDLRNHTTSAEAILWSFLKGRQIEGLKFRRQQSIGPFIVDFYCPEIKLVIELDGQVHTSQSAIEYDQTRTDYLMKIAGVHIMRFENLFVFRYPGIIVKEIREYAARII